MPLVKSSTAVIENFLGKVIKVKEKEGKDVGEMWLEKFAC